MRYLWAFAQFWYDFIVGDSVFLAIGVLAAAVLTAGAETRHVGILAESLLPAVVVVTLLTSLPIRSRWISRRNL